MLLKKIWREMIERRCINSKYGQLENKHQNHSDFYAGRILTVCEYKRVDEEEGDGGKLEAN